MFSLVKFDSGEHYVLPSKRVKIIQGKNCVIKYKNGGKYSGCLIDVSESEEKLKKLQEEIKSFQNIKEKESDQCVAKEKDGVQLIPFSTVINEETLCRPFIQMPNILDSSTINDSISNQNVHLISSSTPINNKISCDSNIQLSTTLNKQYDTADNNQATDTHTQLDIIEKNVMENNINKSFISESSSAPSGITDIINNIGNDWMTSAENDLNNNDNNYDNQDRDQESIINNEYNHSDEIVKDSDYVLNSDELTKNQDSSINKNSTNSNNTHNSSQSHSKEDSSMENSSLQNVPPIDIRNVEVPCSKDSSSKRTVKKYFCTYCKKLQTKFARHLELKHKTESDVQKFIHIKKGTHERAKIIAAIRNHGSLLHNTHHELNTGVLITARQRQAKYKKSADDYICCTNCNGFYSKLTIRLHFSKCKTTHKKGVREITVMGKRLTGYIHTSANEVLRKIIFPVLRDDKVTRCIKYDELLILFGNKLCERYTNTHQHDMIRAHLRLLGRYKLAVQDINKEIDDFQLIFRPQNFNTAVKALRIVAKWEASIMWFKTPAVANTLTTLLKKCAATLQAECIRKQDYKTKQAVDDFLILWRDEVPTLINRKAIEDQIKYKRQKKVILPSKQDIKLLYDYLKKQCKASLNILEKNFDLSSWKTLTQCTLILVQIFNRRRAGEIERLTITDYKNQEILDKNVNPDIYEKLSEESRQYAKKFARITIRGKLGRTVPVLLNALVIKSIDTILKYRNKAGIKSNNEYIFSVLNATKLKKKIFKSLSSYEKVFSKMWCNHSIFFTRNYSSKTNCYIYCNAEY
ncbi:uncharacterized protein [Temnothorax nylanderi]|uniref:uncharacterized protein n=1 Tax=Temnothorax nylanderi TaxID=102681 RepID=UPI003A89BEBA